MMGSAPIFAALAMLRAKRRATAIWLPVVN